MGLSGSKSSLRRPSNRDGSSPAENQNFRRSSRHRQSKADRANAISINIQDVKSQVEKFNGFRGDSRYQSIQSELTRYSQEVQEVKAKAKPATKDLCSNLQADIVDLLRKLEEIVEKNESELDLAAVESHSFIDQTPSTRKKPMPVIQEQAGKSTSLERDRDRQMMNISELEESTNNLMKEINRAIELGNTSEFVVFEKKIGILYADLTTIDMEKNDPLYERKESISRKLIRYNNKLKTQKNRASSVIDKEADRLRKIEQELLVISQIEDSLVDLEVKVMLFEDVKSDPKYRELDQALKGYWSKLQVLEDTSEDTRRKKLKTINLIKKNLQALSSKAEENNNKIKVALEKVNSLEEDVLALKVVVDNYQGFKNDLDYTNIDQTIRSLWAKLNDIHSSYSKVEEKKNETVKVVQNMLTTLTQNAEKYEAKVIKGREKLNASNSKTNKAINVVEDAASDDELKRLQNQWNSLNLVLEEHITIDNQNNIQSILATIQNDIKRLTDRLEEMKQNYSNSKSQSQNQYRTNRSSVMIVKTKEEKPIKTKEEKTKTKSPANFQPQELLLQELSSSLVNGPGKAQPQVQQVSSVESIIDKIEILNNKLNIVTREIQNCKPSDCDEMKNKLQKLENELTSIETNLNPIVTDSKSEVSKTIKSLYSMIEDKMKRDTKEETAKLKVIVENLQKVKKKVDCFSGTYGNVQFLQIQTELNDCMLALGDIDCKDNEKLENSKKQVSQKINQYLNILDERSFKVSSLEDLTAVPEQESFVDISNKLVEKLSDIRSKLEQYELNGNNYFEKDFDEALNMLNSLVPETEEHRTSKDYYTGYLNQLITYYKSKIPDVSLFTDLERVVNDLKKEATELGNLLMDNQTINQRISATLTNIRKMHAEEESEKALKGRLMNDIRTIGILLQTKESILKDLDKISTEIEQFSGLNYKKTYNDLDEKLTAIFLKIEEIPINQDEQYVRLRDNLIKKVQGYQKVLNTKLKAMKEVDAELDGTEV